MYWLPYTSQLPSLSHTDSLPSLNLLCHSKTDARFMQDGKKTVWSIPHVSVASFSSLKHNFIAYRSFSRPNSIFETYQLWQSGFSRVYSNSYCRCSFEPEIIKNGQSSHKMYSNNILNFQESTTILNACTKKVWKLIEGSTYIHTYIHTYICVCVCVFYWQTDKYYKQLERNKKLCDAYIYMYTHAHVHTLIHTHIHFFSSYNVWKHVRYPSLISRQPGW